MKRILLCLSLCFIASISFSQDFDWAFSKLNIYRLGGNVGIGNSSPAFKLDVTGDIRTSAWLRSSGDYGLFNSSDGTYFHSDDVNYFKMRSDRGLRIANKFGTTKGYLYHNNSNSFGLLDADGQWGFRMERDSYTSFLINNSEKMRILSSGNIGVGTTAPTQKLDVNGNARIRGNLQINSAGYIDDDGTFGGNSDDWIRLNGYVEAKSNTDSYGLVIRDKDQNGYVAITEKDNVAYFSENTSSGSYFMKGDGRNTTFGGKVIATRAGLSGTYNSAQVQGIWSIGSGFTIDQTANTFGTQYGLVYAHTNSGQGITGWQHQIMHVNNGAVKSSISMTYGHAYFAGNMGLGTQTPAHKLDVAGTINATEYLLNGQPLNTGGGSIDGVTSLGGNIGIGTTTPDSKLSIYGTDAEGWNSGIELNRQDGGKGWIVADASGMKFRTPNAGDHFYFRNSANATTLIIAENGEVGIGTADPNASLHVNGGVIIGDQTVNTDAGYNLHVQKGIRTEKVQVDVKSVWPDYVFDQELKPLAEVAAYIEKNKHLENIPSAEEVKENGIDLAEMNVKLLEKVEKLTLYLIEQNKKMEALSKKMEALERK